MPDFRVTITAHISARDKTEAQEIAVEIFGVHEGVSPELVAVETADEARDNDALAAKFIKENDHAESR